MFPEPFTDIFFWAFNFFIAFVASFLGSICVDLLTPLQTRRKPISTRTMLVKGCAFSFFVAIILSAIYEKYEFTYPIYMAAAGCVGGSGDMIFKLFINKNFAKRFVKHLLKNCKSLILKSASDAFEEDDNKKKNNSE